MKIRTDFVTNSSSSSFVISTKHLTNDQILKLQRFAEVAEELDLEYCEEAYCWHIEVDGSEVTGSTSMDNFDARDLFHAIGINPDLIEWDY
jgi:hypothetical protein